MPAKKAKPKAQTPPGDWRAETLADVRRLILAADPEIVEEIKWVKPTNPAGVPVWSRGGIVCTGETYKAAVKLTFAKGAALKDPKKLFNAGLDGNVRRAIDITEGESLDPAAFTALVRAAVAENFGAKTKKAKAAPVKLLSGGNPQIAKGYGDEPVKAYIEAMPGWKREVGRRLDELITKAVPGVRKAVKWNSPLYGAGDEDRGWFLGLHCFAKYIKVAFFKGASFTPLPPGPSKQKAVRYLDVREGDPLDEAQFSDWVRQASQIPGEKM
jgi:hypothetical protein